MLILFLVLCAYIIYPKERLCGRIYNDCEYGFAPLIGNRLTMKLMVEFSRLFVTSNQIASLVRSNHNCYSNAILLMNTPQ